MSPKAMLAASLLLGGAAAGQWPQDESGLSATDVPASFDCAMRKLAYTYGQQLLPRLGGFDQLFDALGLNVDCQDDPTPPVHSTEPVAPPIRRAAPAGAVYADAAQGADGPACGHRTAPCKSLQAAVDRAGAGGTVVLRDSAVFYLAEAVVLTSAHSGLTIQADINASPVVSGGVELSAPAWSRYNDGNSTDNVWVADVSASGLKQVPGLQMDGVRATRARYPNLPHGLEASCGYGCVILGKDAIWTPPNLTKFGPVTYYTDNRTATLRNNTPSGWFQHYMTGVNGLCSVYDPPVGYWCSEHPSGGGARAYRTPDGVTPKAGALPNSPYKDVSQAIVNVWRAGRWANWMFEVRAFFVGVSSE